MGVLTNTLHPDGGGYWCTGWAHFFMYLAYGKDYNCGDRGNGAQMAKTLADTYPDEWEIAPGNIPTAGAIFSVTEINDHAGHVGMITKVEGNKIWYCDGNLSGSGWNTRLNQETTLEEFVTRWKAPVYFANHK